MNGGRFVSAQAWRRLASGWFDRVVVPVHNATLSRSFAYWTTLVVVLAVLLVAEILLAYRSAEGAAARNARTLSYASELRARADRELNAVLYLANGMAAYFAVRHTTIDPVEIDALLKEIYGQGRHLRNIVLAVGYRTRFVYPRAGNESVLDQDYREIPGQWPIVKSAIERRGGMLTGPVALVQGGTGLIYRMPIFIDKQYWGMLSVVIDMAEFNATALRSNGMPYSEFAVRSVEPEAGAGGLLWGRASLFDEPGVVRLESDVPGGYWVYAVRNLEVEDGRMVWLLRLLAVLLAALAGAAVHTVLGQRRALSHQAGIDPLTELPNRRLFDDRLEQSLRRQARDNQRAVAVVFLDLNGFKAYNDRYGHRFGDAVLRVVGRRLRDEVRLSDTVSRWAGDEYALIVEDAQPDEVTQLVNRLRSIVAAPFRVEGTPVTVTAAFGIAFYPQEAVSAEGLLELADQRMYADKQTLATASGSGR